jgi:small GTP-binding protein
MDTEIDLTEKVTPTSSRGGRFKVVFLGNAKVGKTSLIRKYMGRGFRTQYLMTIGADFSLKQIDNHSILIWDLAGQKGFDNVRKSYYWGTNGAIIVYDVTNEKSFEELDMWLKEMNENIQETPPLMIVGNKIDLRNEASNSISPEDGKVYANELSKKLNIPVLWTETSALTGENVETMFSLLVNEIVKVVLK